MWCVIADQYPPVVLSIVGRGDRQMAHILIIDDAADICLMVGLLLQSVGHTVSSATNGLSGLHCAQTELPDLILMDLGLPQLDGWEVTRRLQADDQTAHIPVLAFTANVTETAREAARAVGCCGMITKPCDLDQLLRLVDALLMHHDASEKERVVG
jgi:CheY-like chemotaxis protein